MITETTSKPPPEVPELIPVRMLNEFTYCPRLAYLEWVQGEFQDNLETREGTFAHRNVDRPSRIPVPEAAEDAEPPAESTAAEKIHARSLLLSAPTEGLIAKLDLLELDGQSATPIDYKRGSVPDHPAGAWEPEQIQLCAQGLILQENGFECSKGVIYYVESRRRVTIDFTPGLIAKTRGLLQELRQTAERGQIPPPLEDSPKCPRCALVSICLPDETNLLRHAEPNRTPAKASLRRLQPTRENALPLYVQNQGATVGKSGERLTISERKRKLRTVKLKDVSQVCLFGNVQLSAAALKELATRGIPLCHFSYGGWFQAITQGFSHKNIELRIAQFATAADSTASLQLARRFVVGKIKNARTMLRRHSQGDQRRALQQLAELSQEAEKATSAESLLGIEGMAAKTYFAGFGSLFKSEHPFDLNGRNRRPPKDPVNALLSFVYALLVKDLSIVLQAVGLDPLLGFYHRPRYGRPSLALDLAEEFRPLIGDSVVLTLINNGEVSPASFLSQAGAVALTEAGRRAVLAAYERRMDSEITHPLFGYKISYRRILAVQARLLTRTLLGELAEYPIFCTR